MVDRAPKGRGLEEAAERAIEAVELELKRDNQTPTRRPVRRSVSCLDRRQYLFQKFEDIIKNANQDALQTTTDHKLYKSRSFNYKGASSFTPRTSAPGTGTGFDPRAGFINNRSLSMGHYGRMRFASADGTGRGIELSTSGRLLNSGLVVESVREEAEEGEEGEEEALPAPPSPGVEEGGREEEEAKQGPGSAVEAPTSRLRTATTPAHPPPGLMPDGTTAPEAEEAARSAEGKGELELERGASGEVSGDASDPLGLGYGGDEDGGGGHSDGLGADGGERRSVNGTTQPPKNPWAPLPGPCPKALLHLHARQVQQTQRALTTVDSMRLARQGHA